MTGFTTSCNLYHLTLIYMSKWSSSATVRRPVEGYTVVARWYNVCGIMYPTVPLPSLDESSPLNRFLFYSPSRKNIMSVFILLCFVLCVAEEGVGLNFLRRALFLLMYSPNEKWIVTCNFTCFEWDFYFEWEWLFWRNTYVL